MSSTHGTYWFWSDWLGDQAVRRLSPAARGVWIDCLALMAVANPTGYLCDERGKPLTHEEIARVVNATPTDVANLLAEVLEKGVASRDRTGRLFNRRMVRKASIAAKKRLSGKKGGDATRLKWQSLSSVPQQAPQHLLRHPDVAPYQSSKITSSSFVAAREGENSKPARSLATALPTGALASEPKTEPAERPQEVWRGKSPSSVDRTELAALYASKRG